MTSAISEYLPLAFGVTLSTMPIIAMIVLTVIGEAKTKGTLFLLGWMIAIIGFMVIVVLLGNAANSGTSSEPSVWSIILQFGFAFFLLYLAWDNWRKRPKDGDEIKAPAWIAGLSKMSNAAVFGLGMMIAVFNAKNLPILVSAAIIISQAHDSWGSGLLDAVIFTLIGTIGVALPWFISIIGGDKMKPMLERMRDWLYKYNNIIMTLLFGFLGISALSNALALVT